MRQNWRIAVLVSVLGLLAGCSGEATTSTADSRISNPPITSEHNSDVRLDDEDWALKIVAESQAWFSVTEQAIATSPAFATLCVEAAISPDPSLGPHSEHAYWVKVNPVGMSIFLQGDPMPAGSVVVKEKYVRRSQTHSPAQMTALGVMIKREPGYAPENGDWEYAYITLDNTTQFQNVTRGRIATCIDCHANRSETDFLFRNYLSEDDSPVDLTRPENLRVPGLQTR